MRELLEAQKRAAGLGLGQMSMFGGVLDALRTQEQLLGIGSAARIAAEMETGWRRQLQPFEQSTLSAYEQLAAAAGGPLMRLRAEILYETELATIASTHKSRFASTFSDAMEAYENSIGATMRKLSGRTDSVASQMVKALEDSTKAQLQAFSDPFASIGDRLGREIETAKSLTDMFDPGQWARSLGAPMLDAASIATVARAWGAEGAIRNLRELGAIDQATLRMIAEAIDAEYEAVDEDGSEPLQRDSISLDTLLAIFSILLAIAMYQWQQEDSAATEARSRAEHQAISAQIGAADERAAERVEKLARAFESVVAQMQTASTEQARFVVRSRGALIRKGKGGFAVVAETVPGQVVTLIAEEGKWIEVSYFDFVAGKQRAGWALKKYFIRVRPGDASLKPQFIARREQRKMLDLMGKLEWDQSFDYKAERSRS